MSEPTGTDADDRSTITATMRRGALVNELAARHAGYKRAVLGLQRRVSDTLLLLDVTEATPDQLRPALFPDQMRAVREAAEVFEAARLALADYRDND